MKKRFLSYIFLLLSNIGSAQYRSGIIKSDYQTVSTNAEPVAPQNWFQEDNNYNISNTIYKCEFEGNVYEFYDESAKNQFCDLGTECIALKSCQSTILDFEAKAISIQEGISSMYNSALHNSNYSGSQVANGLRNLKNAIAQLPCEYRNLAIAYNHAEISARYAEQVRGDKFDNNWTYELSAKCEEEFSGCIESLNSVLQEIIDDLNNRLVLMKMLLNGPLY